MAATATLSVVIPSYNAARYVATTLRSVLAQQLDGIEVIVVDDGSSDGTPALIAREFPQVRVLQQANQGVAVARNAGIDAARGEWIAFVDADDVWLPGKLAAQLSALAAHGQARMSYTAWHVWHATDPEPAPALLAELAAVSDQDARWAGPSGWIYPDLLLCCEVWTSTVVVHRSVLAEVGRFEPGLRQAEDWDLWLRASRITPIVRVPRPLALYRMHPNNITRSLPERNYAHEVVSRAVARWGYRGPDGRAMAPAAVQRALAGTWSDLAGLCLIRGDVQRARQAARCGIAVHPPHLKNWKLWLKACLLSGLGRGASSGPAP